MFGYEIHTMNNGWRRWWRRQSYFFSHYISFECHKSVMPKFSTDVYTGFVFWHEKRVSHAFDTRQTSGKNVHNANVTYGVTIRMVHIWRCSISWIGTNIRVYIECVLFHEDRRNEPTKKRIQHLLNFILALRHFFVCLYIFPWKTIFRILVAFTWVSIFGFENCAHHAITHWVECAHLAFLPFSVALFGVSLGRRQQRRFFYSLRNAVFFRHNDLSFTNFVPFQFHYILSFPFVCACFS